MLQKCAIFTYKYIFFDILVKNCQVILGVNGIHGKRLGDYGKFRQNYGLFMGTNRHIPGGKMMKNWLRNINWFSLP